MNVEWDILLKIYQRESRNSEPVATVVLVVNLVAGRGKLDSHKNG